MKNVTYEWDVETHTATDTPEHEADEVIDHDHRDSYAECLAIARGEPPAGCKFRIVLVRDRADPLDAGRSWAYVENGALPTHFIDAYGRDVARVPAKFVKEVADAAAAAVVFSPKFVQAFGRTWNAIGYDALEIAGDDNAAAVELVLDADRLLTFGDDAEAYAEYRELLRVHGYRAVHRAAVKRFPLV